VPVTGRSRSSLAAARTAASMATSLAPSPDAVAVVTVASAAHSEGRRPATTRGTTRPRTRRFALLGKICTRRFALSASHSPLRTLGFALAALHDPLRTSRFAASHNEPLRNNLQQLAALHHKLASRFAPLAASHH
jgi:hypothetical protein